MANPLDLRGPEFLFVYLIFGVAVILLLRFLILHKEKQSYRSRWDYTDPYKLAYLRGGVNESLRVVLFSLIDRGLIKSSGEQVTAVRNAAEIVLRPIEQAVLKVFGSPREIKELFTDAGAAAAAEQYRHTLAAEGFMADDEVFAERARISLAALFLVAGLSLLKIVTALSRGRHNIGLLITLTLIFSGGILMVWRMNRTGAGYEALRELGLRFRSLKLRAASIRPGSMTNEAALLAAVFGLSVLPDLYFPYIKSLFPRTAAAANSSGGCGSSGCGSSGCGGGGCGGGCGGCGG